MGGCLRFFGGVSGFFFGGGGSTYVAGGTELALPVLDFGGELLEQSFLHPPNRGGLPARLQRQLQKGGGGALLGGLSCTPKPAPTPSHPPPSHKSDLAPPTLPQNLGSSGSSRHPKICSVPPPSPPKPAPVPPMSPPRPGQSPLRPSCPPQYLPVTTSKPAGPSRYFLVSLPVFPSASSSLPVSPSASSRLPVPLPHSQCLPVPPPDSQCLPVLPPHSQFPPSEPGCSPHG